MPQRPSLRGCRFSRHGASAQIEPPVSGSAADGALRRPALAAAHGPGKADGTKTASERDNAHTQACCSGRQDSRLLLPCRSRCCPVRHRRRRVARTRNHGAGCSSTSVTSCRAHRACRRWRWRRRFYTVVAATWAWTPPSPTPAQKGKRKGARLCSVHRSRGTTLGARGTEAQRTAATCCRL